MALVESPNLVGFLLNRFRIDRYLVVANFGVRRANSDLNQLHHGTGSRHRSLERRSLLEDIDLLCVRPFHLRFLLVSQPAVVLSEQRVVGHRRGGRRCAD